MLRRTYRTFSITREMTKRPTLPLKASASKLPLCRISTQQANSRKYLWKNIVSRHTFKTLFISTLLVFLLISQPVFAEVERQDRRATNGNARRLVLDKTGEVPCGDYPDVLKEMVRKQLEQAQAKAQGKEVPVEAEQNGECLNICDLCKTKDAIVKPVTPEKETVKQKICLGAPPIVNVYLPYKTAKHTTSVYLEMPTDPEILAKIPPGVPQSDLYKYIPHGANSHAALLNQILRAEIPPDVTAKLLAYYLYNQKDIKLFQALKNQTAQSPFEGQEPAKPVGYSGQVGVGKYTNIIFICNNNPADLNDLKY